MKKSWIVYLTGLVLFIACENNNSSTVGSYDKEETQEEVMEEQKVDAEDKDSVTTDVIIGPRTGEIPDTVSTSPLPQNRD